MSAATAALLVAAAACASTEAAPLEPQACEALKTERMRLVADGAKADMDRGPEWAKANLAPDRLGKIERLIALDEQLSFRCGEQLTARPVLKEPPKPPQPDKPPAEKQAAKPAGDLMDGLMPSAIPPPKKKSKPPAPN
jgi:hypothetical protein